MNNYIINMRKDLNLSRAAFGRKYNIPTRTLEAWENEEREAPDYVIDFLGRVVYADISGKKPLFYVVAIGKVDEWDCGKFESYLEAVKCAKAEREHSNKSHVLEVEIRLYEDDVENEDCENFDCDLVSF